MDNKKLGALICELRKEKSMTQKQLAEILNVTDKAVSKWERGNGFPEITIIPELARALGVTANELLGGQRNAKEHIGLNDAEDIINDTIKYIEDIKKIDFSKILAIISISILLAIFTCLLCNYSINGSFDWSLYPTGGLVIAWITIAPFFIMKNHRFLVGLVGMTLSAIPYLFLIEYLCPVKGWVIPMALPITGITFILLLAVCFLFKYIRISGYYAAAITTFMSGVIVNLAVNEIVSRYLGESVKDISVIITALSFAVISLSLAVIGWAKSRERSN